MARTRRLPFAVPVFVAAVLMAPATGLAQRPITFGVSGGVTPTSAVRPSGLTYESGAHAQVSVERVRILGRLGVRLDAFVHGFSRPTFSGFQTGHTSVPGASVSAVLPLAARSARLQPYLLAGSGTYRTEFGGGFSNPEWHHGLSAGGGLELAQGRTRPFIESRVIRVYDGATPRMVPVTIGLRF